MIINNNIQFNNIIEELKIEENVILNENQENNGIISNSRFSIEDNKENDVVFCISSIDIKNNDLFIEKEILQSDMSLITQNRSKNESDFTENVNNKTLGSINSKNLIKKKNKAIITEKNVKIISAVICIIIACCMAYILYFIFFGL